MSVPHPRNSRVSHVLFFLALYPGFMICTDVTLSSIEIFTTHEWLSPTPTVYFRCRGENKTYLPDVKKKHTFYAFKGEESWQPLTNFSGKKCKRCGVYEEDKILSDDVFDEWELCPSDFGSPGGRYVHFKDKELNATFTCSECLPMPGGGGGGGGGGGSISAPAVNHNEKGISVTVIILISVSVSTVLILGIVGVYKYWQKKKREQDQARFLKLFEDGDDIEDELGLGTII